MKLSDANLTVTIEKTPRGGWQGYVDTVSGKCFDDGTHVRALFWYDGKKADFKAELADYISGDSVVDCEDPECDACHPVEEES